ncbi:hypothetical protein [Streptomyces sp. NPDC004783]|uniref:hypothetical protein n=1 Tax=Streptomyces sp. NPDC004783 TaxID=3154459 RepID=UPI0033BE8C4C
MCAALTGCSTNSSADDPRHAPPSTTSATVSGSPSTRSAAPSPDPGAPIEAAYRKYWEEKVKAYAKASVQGTDLKKYAVAEAFTAAEMEVQALKTKGLVATGKPVLAPKVTSVDNKRKVPQGTLSDCTDVSGWTLVQQSNGADVTLPDDRLTRYVTKAVAEKWYGRWVIVKVTPEDRSC